MWTRRGEFRRLHSQFAIRGPHSNSPHGSVTSKNQSKGLDCPSEWASSVQEHHSSLKKDLYTFPRPRTFESSRGSPLLEADMQAGQPAVTWKDLPVASRWWSVPATGRASPSQVHLCCAQGGCLGLGLDTSVKKKTERTEKMLVN